MSTKPPPDRSGFDAVRPMTKTAHAREFFPGSTRVAPGIWLDRDGNIHWSVPELLALVDLPDTPENRESVIAMLREQLGEHFPQSEHVLILPKPDA